MSNQRRNTILVLVCLALVLLLGAYLTYHVVTRSNVQESSAGLALGAPGEATYISVTGVPIDLTQKLGREALYINSWASWSPLSRDELIALDTIAGEYKDRGITFVALNRKEPKETAERYLATLPPLPNLQIVIDSSDFFYNQVEGYAMPETLFYTDSGELWRHERQPLTTESMRALVNSYLEAVE